MFRMYHVSRVEVVGRDKVELWARTYTEHGIKRFLIEDHYLGIFETATFIYNGDKWYVRVSPTSTAQAEIDVHMRDVIERS